jgi:hypothetical protein
MNLTLKRKSKRTLYSPLITKLYGGKCVGHPGEDPRVHIILHISLTRELGLDTVFCEKRIRDVMLYNTASCSKINTVQ